MRKMIGTIPVDSGMIWIGDPCRLIKGDKWNEFCDQVGAGNHWQYENGIAISGFGGDGSYHTAIETDERGLVRSVTVYFGEPNPVTRRPR